MNRKMAELLRKQGNQLVAAGRKLLEAADILDRPPLDITCIPVEAEHAGNGEHATISGSPLTRKEQVKLLLTEEGPKRPNEMMEKLRIPRGSLYAVLKDKNTFEQDGTGNWKLKARKEEEDL